MINVALWGCGSNSERIFNMIKNQVNIIGFFDNDASKHGAFFRDKRVYGPNDLTALQACDFILITVYPYAQDIYDQLKKDLHIDPVKILCLGLHWDSFKLAENFRIINDFCCNNNEIDDFRLEPSQFILHRKMEWDNYVLARSDNYDRLVYSDYSRFRTFELCADLIRHDSRDEISSASVAEVGVFRGDFASLINANFPDRTLYLFDTFEGFNSAECAREIAKEDLSDEILKCFRETSIDVVLKKMPFVERCVVKKGLFPDTAMGLEHVRFAFVSIDVDLHDSIYSSLVYFYPRLVEGGYLFVHEYNHGSWPGVKKAVQLYEKEHGYMCKLPLADNNGTLVITK